MFNRTGFKKKQKVYVVGRAEFGRIEDIKGGMIKVQGFKSGEMWVKPHEIEPGH